jgi:hypothetical protein
MKYLEEIKEMLCEELEKIGKKGELSAGSLDIVHKLTDTIKNIDKIEMLEEGGGSSYDDEGGMWTAKGSYDNGRSEARGRGRNAKRDSMGRYSRDNRGGNHDGGSSYRGGYSRDDAKSEMMQELEEIMDKASSEQERSIIRRAVESLERM